MPATSLIVGGNRGIGLGLVEEALTHSSDSVVFATARDPANAPELHRLQETYPGRVVVLKADIIDEDSLKAAAVELKCHTETLDTVIINAGILLGFGPVEELKSTDFLENLHTNVVGPHTATKIFAPFLLASTAAKRNLVYISSVAATLVAIDMVSGFLKGALKTDYLPVSGYAVTKTAVNQLGRQWASGLEDKGVSVLLVHPGTVATGISDATMDGLISIAESATGVWSVINKSTLGDGAKGILSYDGSVIPW